MTFVEQLGSQIRYTRKWYGKTQARLAQQLGVAEFTVWRWEHGVHAPSVAAIGQIAKALGVPATWLFTEPPASRPDP